MAIGGGVLTISTMFARPCAMASMTWYPAARGLRNPNRGPGTGGWMSVTAEVVDADAGAADDTLIPSPMATAAIIVTIATPMDRPERNTRASSPKNRRTHSENAERLPGWNRRDGCGVRPAAQRADPATA